MEKTNYTIFLSGRQIPVHLRKYSHRIKRETYLKDFDKFAKIFEQSKVVLIPAVYDASPRMITQAFVLNVTVIANK